MEKPKTVARLLNISGIWSVPIVLVVLESLVFITKQGWQTHNIIYYIAFWVIRIFLTPLIIYYTTRFWVELKKKTRLVITHLVGFFLYSLVFTTVAYLSLYKLLTENFFPFVKDSSKAYIYGLILDNSISINIIVYLSTVVICYILVYSRREMAANQKALELEKSLVTSRLDVLKNQLNTHFLFNTLHTINSLVTQGKKEEASEMIVKLSDLLRFALRENDEQLIPVSTELEMLQTYIDITKTRFGDKLDMKVIVEEEVDIYLIPVFVLQPLVENAIKHAIEPLSTKGNITVHIKKSNDSLFISITDNGKTPFSDIDFSTGIGIKNTRERLQKLYGNDYDMSFHPNEREGITVSLQIPLTTSTTSTVYELENINS
jgi:sensor histidine kinase YesM